MDSTSSPGPGASRLRPYRASSEQERLLEAIVRVAAEKGYGATTTADVTAAAGLPAESFARHFAAKEDCFLAAYEAVSDVVIAHVSTAYEASAGRPWPERIVAGLRALVELLAAEPEITRMAMIDVGSLGEEARVRYRTALERFVPLLEEGRDHSTDDAAGLPDETAQFAIGGVASMIFDELRAGRGEELPAALPELAFAMLMPYLGAAAAEAEMERVAAEV